MPIPTIWWSARLLAIEDRRASAIIWASIHRGIARAFLAQHRCRPGWWQGGSTIHAATGQGALSGKRASAGPLRRKVQENVHVSLRLEAKPGKEEILTRYLNSILISAPAPPASSGRRPVYFDKEVR